MCGQSVVDTGLSFDQFVRVRDTRDPALQGGLTLSGTTTTGDMLRACKAPPPWWRGDLMTVDLATARRACKSEQRPAQRQLQRPAQRQPWAPSRAQADKWQGWCHGQQLCGRCHGPRARHRWVLATVGSLFGDNTWVHVQRARCSPYKPALVWTRLAVHDNGAHRAQASRWLRRLWFDPAVTAGRPARRVLEVPATQVTAAAVTVIRALAGGGFATCAGGSGHRLPAWPMRAMRSPDGSTAVTQSAVVSFAAAGATCALVARFGSRWPPRALAWQTGGTVPKPVWPRAPLASACT